MKLWKCYYVLGDNANVLYGILSICKLNAFLQTGVQDINKTNVTNKCCNLSDIASTPNVALKTNSVIICLYYHMFIFN